jgi:hypothetical protein
LVGLLIVKRSDSSSAKLVAKSVNSTLFSAPATPNLSSTSLIPFTSPKKMHKSMKSTIALSLIYLLGCSAPAFAQMAGGFEDGGSKVADIDILTNSPTLGNQSSAPSSMGYQGNVPAPQTPMLNMSAVMQVQNPQNGFAAPNSTPIQTGMAVQNGFAAQNAPGQVAPGQMGQPAIQPQNNRPAQPAAQRAPIQVNGQMVSRVVGVAGTALVLTAIMKNGGVGGMMNPFGFNRYRGRGAAFMPYLNPYSYPYPY